MRTKNLHWFFSHIIKIIVIELVKFVFFSTNSDKIWNFSNKSRHQRPCEASFSKFLDELWSDNFEIAPGHKETSPDEIISIKFYHALTTKFIETPHTQSKNRMQICISQLINFSWLTDRITQYHVINYFLNKNSPITSILHEFP